MQFVEGVPAFYWVSVFVRAGPGLACLSSPQTLPELLFCSLEQKKQVSCEGLSSWGHHLKIKGHRDKGELAEPLLTQRRINIWNRLTCEVAEAML